MSASRMNWRTNYATDRPKGAAAWVTGFEQSRVGSAPLARLWRAWKHRREVSRLLGVENHMLADIGITRQDVKGALAAPLSRDPLHLLVRAREERHRALADAFRRRLRSWLTK